MTDEQLTSNVIDASRSRFPFCIVWTPLPLLTWLFPLIGHVGIGTSQGVIRDFAGPYFVAEDDMAFGVPTKYLQLDYNLVPGGILGWDEGVDKASNLYCKRMVIFIFIWILIWCDFFDSIICVGIIVILMFRQRWTTWNTMTKAITIWSKYFSS